MKGRTTLWLSAIIIALFVCHSALAQPGPRRGGPDKKWITEELNLTDEQKVKLDEIREEYREKMKDKRAVMQEAREKLHDALISDASDEVLRKQFKTMQEIRNEFATARFEKILAIRQILTKEQRKKFDELRSERKRGRKYRRPREPGPINRPMP